MTSEGGGKIRQKRSRTSKPYDRPKSIFSRMTDAVRGIFSPSWVTGLLTTQEANEEPQVNCNNNVDDHSTATQRRNSLNSLPGPSGVTFPHANDKRLLSKARIPLDSDRGHLWNPSTINRDRSTPYSEISDQLTSPAFTSDLLGEPVAGPSTSTPSDGALGGANECVSRRNGERERTNARSLSSSSTPVPQADSRHLYAKLSGIGKLNRYSPIVDRKEELESGSNLAVSDSHSECSEESISTSGCSSMVPHPDKREYQRDVLQFSKPALQKLSDDLRASLPSEDKNGRCWDRTTGINDRSSVKTPSFLFSESNATVGNSNKPQPTAAGSKPQFRPYLLGSPIWKDNSLLQTSPSNHSFNGKVAYGFRSNRKTRLNTTAPYTDMSAASRRRVQVKPAQNSDLDVMSSTTKRILETLEKMSTPLMDAKRIPTNKVDIVLDTPLTFTSTYRRWPSLANKSVSQVKKVENQTISSISRGPPVSRLMTQGSIAVTKISPKPEEDAPMMVLSVKTTDMSQELRGIKRGAIPQPPEDESKRTKSGKMKTSHRSHYSRTAADDDVEPIEVLDLPAVSLPLPLKKLPVFDIFPQSTGIGQTNTKSEPPKYFGTSSADSAPPKPSVAWGSKNELASKPKAPLPLVAVKSPATTSASFTIPTVNNTAANVNSAPVSFKFSSPVPVKESRDEATDRRAKPLTSQEPQFKFSTPDTVDSKSGSLQDKVSDAKGPNVSTNFSFGSLAATPVVSVNQKSEHTVGSPSKSGGIPVASELKSGSVLELLAKFAESNQKKSLADEKVGADLKAVTTSWSSKGTPASTTSSDTKSSTTVSSGFGNISQPETGNWECPTCLIINRANVGSCVACETKKPATKKVDTSINASTAPSFGFGDKFKSAADTWECPSCMLRVKQDLDKCAACNTAKPGAKLAPKFETASARAELKNLTPKPDSQMWECNTCLIKNQPNVVKCIACESPKPGAAPLPTTLPAFKFGFTTLFNTSSTATPLADSVASGNTAAPPIKFGISPATSTSVSVPAPVEMKASTGFSFGLKPATTAPATFQFGIPTTTSAKTETVGFKFSSSIPSQVDGLAQKQPLATAEDKSTRLANDTPTAQDIPPTTVAPPAYGISLQQFAGKPSSNSSNLLAIGSGKSETPPLMFNATVAPSVTTVTTSEAFTLNNGKSSVEGAVVFPPPTSAPMSMLPPASLAAAVAPSSGFNFTFGGDTTKSTLPVAKPQQGAAFAFADTKVASKDVAAAPPSGGFAFTFSSGSKRRSDAIEDGGDSAKAPFGAAGLPAFGSFASTGNNMNKPAPQSSGFTFGGTTSTPSATPVFGALSSGTDKPAASNTFTFGASPTTANAMPSLPTFNAAAPIFETKQQPVLNFSTSAPAFGGATQTSTFTFASQNAIANNNAVPAFGSVAAPAAVPTFGGSTSSNNLFNSSTAAPAFGSVFGASMPQAPAVNPAPSLPAQGFNFGTTPSSFQFGGQAPQTQSGVFTFSGNQSNNPFGQMAQQPNPQQVVQPPGFFGATPAGGLNFAPSVPPLGTTNPFEIQNRNIGNRTIKKAKRRNQLK